MALSISQLTFETIFVYYICSFVIISLSSFLFIRAVSTHTPIHHKISLSCLLLMLLCTNIYSGIKIAKIMTGVPQISVSHPDNNQILPLINPKINIEFKSPVKFSTLQIHTYPENELFIHTNEYIPKILPFGRSVNISPKYSYPPGVPIMVYISNIEGPLTHGFGGESLLEVHSEQLPTISSLVSPSQNVDIPVNQNIRISLNKNINQFSVWQIQSSPDIHFDITTARNEVLFQPTKPLEQGTAYTFKVLQVPSIVEYASTTGMRQLDPILEQTISLTTIKPPYIKGVTPARSMIFPNEEIVIEFDEPMNTSLSEKQFQLYPNTPHTIFWDQSNTRMRISHSPFPKDSTISALLVKGSKTQKGGILETDIQYQFRTPGAAALDSSFPNHNTSDILRGTSIELLFNQPVLESSVKNRIAMQPQFAYTTTSSESAVTIHSKEKLLPETKYTIVLSPGIESVYGSPSTHSQTFSFTTESEQTILPVEFFKQESAFTCNIAAAKMLLRYKHIDVSEKQLITSIGSGGLRGSGDPNRGYVSDYGTYWEALSKGISAYSVNTVLSHTSLAELLGYVKSGIPVMIWGQNGWSDPHDISWTTPDGIFVKAINGMHSSVVRGFKGTIDNPTEIYLNDPWRGQYSIPVAEFLRRWGYFNVALVLN